MPPWTGPGIAAGVVLAGATAWVLLALARGKPWDEIANPVLTVVVAMLAVIASFAAAKAAKEASEVSKQSLATQLSLYDEALVVVPNLTFEKVAGEHHGICRLHGNVTLINTSRVAVVIERVVVQIMGSSKSADLPTTVLIIVPAGGIVEHDLTGLWTTGVVGSIEYYGCEAQSSSNRRFLTYATHGGRLGTHQRRPYNSPNWPVTYAEVEDFLYEGKYPNR